MKKYAVIPSKVPDEYFWNVYEYATDQIVDSFYFEEDAIDMAKFMNRGGAFDGFTPSFMTIPIKVKNENLNEVFAQEFMV